MSIIFFVSFTSSVIGAICGIGGGVIIRCCTKCQEKVIEYIDIYTENEEPFFIYYPTPAVHVPLLPSDEFIGKSGLGPYGDFVLQTDAMVGKIMEKLEEKGIAEDTMIIFASDNGCGPNVDYPHLLSKGHNPSYIYRGCKGDIWEGGHRIPYIVKYPGVITENIETDKIVSLSLQQGAWKLELCPGSGGPSDLMNKTDLTVLPKFQLYNMISDSGERYNLYENYPEIAEELKTKLIKYIKDGRSTPGEKQENFGGMNNWAEISSWIK